MYKSVYEAYGSLSKGDQATLKRCNLKNMANSPAYFRVLKFTGFSDNAQTLRMLFLFSGMDVSQDDDSGMSVAEALLKAGVKEQNIIQITRSGDNGIEYLKRQLIRCTNISLHSLGELGQFWGDNARRSLLKDYILAEQD